MKEEILRDENQRIIAIKTFYDEGSICYEHKKLDDDHWEVNSYYPNGSPKFIHTRNAEDKLDGVAKEYDEAGNIISEKLFRNDRAVKIPKILKNPDTACLYQDEYKNYIQKNIDVVTPKEISGYINGKLKTDFPGLSINDTLYSEAYNFIFHSVNIGKMKGVIGTNIKSDFGFNLQSLYEEELEKTFKTKVVLSP